VLLDISEPFDIKTSQMWEKLKIMCYFPEDTVLSWEFLTGCRRTVGLPSLPTGGLMEEEKGGGRQKRRD